MSQIVSWLGNAEYGVAGNRLRAPLPIVFRPTDISGCQIWMDANDADAVNANEFGTVVSWHNKGDLSGNFDLSGVADVRYGDNTVNGLNVVTFNGDAYMTSTYALNFQARSMFVVSRRNTDISGGVFTWLTSDTAGGLESGISQSGGTFSYLIAKHPGFAVELEFDTTTDTKGYAELASFVNSATDVSGNYLGLNGVAQTAVVNNLASGYNTGSIGYYLGNYFGGSTLPNDYDMCELIMYDSALDATQIAQVEEYLIAKWAVVNPPPPPFSPDQISGLSVWLDGSQSSTITTSGTDVVSWSNVGSVGGVYAPGSNIATYATDRVAFPPQATLETYAQLPYVSRTMFAVFECVSDLTTITYPYVNLNNGQATDARQFGVSYDSNAHSYYLSVCQSGTNCPVVGAFGALPTGLNLAYAVVDSNSSANTFGYLNNSSNLNTSTDLGNLFNTNPVPYVIGSPVADSPAFRLAEFIEYDSVLSSSNISTVKSYLSDKWSLGL